MAKLPDHIDKNDKDAVAKYFINQRSLNERKKNIDELIEREGKGYTQMIGQPQPQFIDYLIENGYIVKYVEHITWRVWPPPPEKPMRTYDKIVFANEKDIQDRDKAIMQLYDALRLHENDHPVIKKYEEFVTKTRTIYGE
jgi:ribonucleotide reductase beta subunit family protein with ferritin-like domain